MCNFIHSLLCHCNLLTWCVSWLFLRSNSSRLVLLARPEQNAAKHSCDQNSSSKIEYAVLGYISEHKQQMNHWLFLYLLLCMNVDACLESGPLGSKNYIYSFTSLETNTSDIGLERRTTRDDEWSDPWSQNIFTRAGLVTLVTNSTSGTHLVKSDAIPL